jgi:hypothetical protein
LVSGSILLGVFAAISQAGLNTMQDSSPFSRMGSSIKSGIAGLSPMKSLSDKEYEDLLIDKLLKVDAELAVLDEQIADLRAAKKLDCHAQQERTTDRPS